MNIVFHFKYLIEKHYANLTLSCVMLELNKRANGCLGMFLVLKFLLSYLFQNPLFNHFPLENQFQLSQLMSALGNISRKSFKCFRFGTSSSSYATRNHFLSDLLFKLFKNLSSIIMSYSPNSGIWSHTSSTSETYSFSVVSDDMIHNCRDKDSSS